jgi:hypothetical protein
VTDMEQIEAPVGQSDPLTRVPPVRHKLSKFRARNNLPIRCCMQ